MRELERLSSLAVVTDIWLKHSTTRYELSFEIAAFVAFESGLLHFRNNIRVPNHYTLD
jgi:hypothetical protein